MFAKMRPLLMLVAAIGAAWLSGCASGGGGATQSRGTPGVRSALLPAGVHGRLTGRTMRPQYITVHSTENRGGTADQHAHLLLGKGMRSKNNPRFGRSGWVTWHYTVDDREAVQHLLPTEQGDHADYGGLGDRASIGIEICEFRDPARQAAAIDRAARLVASLAQRFGIPDRNIVPHHHWPRWDYKYGKPCPRILLQRGHSPDGWVEGPKWQAFIARVDRYR